MTFTFLNETRSIADSWSDPRASDLWRYNLHYFDDLGAESAVDRRLWHLEAIERWIQCNPPGEGKGWDAYPTSLRIVNWIKLGLADDSALGPNATASLPIQARHLERNLEYHLLGNHLFANAKALVFAGLFLEGAEPDRWLAKGLAILSRQIPEQILPDGGQFERSPMYGALAFEDVLDLINIIRAFGGGASEGTLSSVSTLAEAAGRMRSWVALMCHPDAEISFFNDAAAGVAPPPVELNRYADALAVPAVDVGTRHGSKGAVSAIHLVDSGYIRASAGDAELIIDVAPIGPDHLPGHAHADTLSFELSLLGRRCIVNSGTSRYGEGPERQAERGTRAHSTAMIDGHDSSEVWSGFRVARRAHPVDLVLSHGESDVTISCGHDGYRRLPGKPIHRRTWRLEKRRLLVEDRVEGQFREAEARYILHPDVACRLAEEGASATLWIDNLLIQAKFEGGHARMEAVSYHPQFGLQVPTRCLVLPLNADVPARMELTW